MLGGGYFRGASVLITGYSGTAKTTLSGLFAEAACRNREKVLFVCFDTISDEVVRNLASVNIRLDRYLKSGLLYLTSARSISGGAETYLVRIKAMVEEHNAKYVIIDPVSAWSKTGHDLTIKLIMDRLIEWTKSSGITLLCTSLFDEMSDQTNGVSPLQISTMVDTWINLTYLVQNGERNRGLAIVKSRGMAHSNQLRELLLSDAGVSLAETYSAGGDVMMGTRRWEKEHAVQLEQKASDTQCRTHSRQARKRGVGAAAAIEDAPGCTHSETGREGNIVRVFGGISSRIRYEPIPRLKICANTVTAMPKRKGRRS